MLLRLVDVDSPGSGDGAQTDSDRQDERTTAFLFVSHWHSWHMRLDDALSQNRRPRAVSRQSGDDCLPYCGIHALPEITGGLVRLFWNRPGLAGLVGISRTMGYVWNLPLLCRAVRDGDY